MSVRPLLFSTIKCLTMALLLVLPTAPFAKKSVTVDVNLNKIIGEQNPLYYGGNNIYPNGGQGILGSDGKFDPVEMNAAAKLGLQTYRFPGGSEANLYKWKRAIGPVKNRVDNVSGNNRGNQSNEFGPDEFGRLIETTNFTQGIIMVAWGYETPEDAADWVEYMNSEVGANPNGGKDWAAERAKNGHPEPYGIKYWEIGNEVYGNWELNWGSYPKTYDGKRGKANVAADAKSGTNGMLAFGDADRYVFGGYKYFKQQKAAALSTWKGKKIKTNGKANQSLYVKFAPVSLHDPKQPFVLSINGTQWQRVNTFAHSNSADLHFTLDTKQGKITFGDGNKGKIPPKNEFVVIDYLSGKQPGFIDYYHKMKAVDPTIKIISSFEKESFVKHMASVKQPYDGIAKHYYPWGDRNIYAAAIYAGLGISHKINEILEWMSSYENPSLSGNEQVWLTEYGPGNYIKHMAIMHTVINNHYKDVATLLGHSLFLDNNSPMVLDNGVIKSKALPVEVFSKHMEKNFVDVSTSGAQNSYNKKKFSAVLASASVNDDQSKINVVLTNTSASKQIVSNINISGIKNNVPMQADIWALMSNNGDPFAENDLLNPNNISLTKITHMENANTNMPITIEAGATFIIKWSEKKY